MKIRRSLMSFINKDEPRRYREAVFAPVFFIAASLMVLVCSSVNALSLMDMDALFAVLPISVFILLYSGTFRKKNRSSKRRV